MKSLTQRESASSPSSSWSKEKTHNLSQSGRERQEAQLQLLPRVHGICPDVQTTIQTTAYIYQLLSYYQATSLVCFRWGGERRGDQPKSYVGVSTEIRAEATTSQLSLLLIMMAPSPPPQAARVALPTTTTTTITTTKKKTANNDADNNTNNIHYG